MLLLHSTMLLLYRRASFLLKSVGIFYIPLCFYFIGYVHCNDCPLVVLHSTMLLLYRNLVNCSMDYILFTFHYASTLSARHKMRFYGSPFYIPLCFYFILWYTGGAEGIHGSFTFHYASTLSRANRPFLLGMTLLHSTMLLLYRE